MPNPPSQEGSNKLNDVGVNTAATTFSAGGLLTAWRTLVTMKDRKSGAYLGVTPDTFICTPGGEWAAKQLLLAPTLLRHSAAAEVYGTGTDSPIRGMIRQIIVSPYLGTSFQWVLMQAKKAVVMQEVEPLQLWVSDPDKRNNDTYIDYDAIKYKARIWYGCGMVDHRHAYYSSSTTTPAVG